MTAAIPPSKKTPFSVMAHGFQIYPLFLRLPHIVCKEANTLLKDSASALRFLNSWKSMGGNASCDVVVKVFGAANPLFIRVLSRYFFFAFRLDLNVASGRSPL